MNKHIAIIILALIQLAVPSWMISSSEDILKDGEQFKFKTAPVDPYDIFRGRYVALAMEQDRVAVEDEFWVEVGQNVYLGIENDDQGYAQVTSAHLRRPEGGSYIKASSRYVAKNQLFFRLPFDRYYMNEKKAPRAEKLYRDTNREKRDAHVVVRVLNGKALIEALYIDGKSVESHFENDGQ